MNTAEPTPRPWHIERGLDSDCATYIISSEGEVARLDQVSSEQDEADASLIIKAVNNHDALLEALKDIANRLTGYAQDFSGFDNDGRCDPLDTSEDVKAAQRALDLASIIEEGEPRLEKTSPMTDKKLIREAVANYMRSEGCDCCRDVDAHKEHEATLAKLLGVRKYGDGSGYDFGCYETKTKRAK